MQPHMDLSTKYKSGQGTQRHLYGILYSFMSLFTRFMSMVIAYLIVFYYCLVYT
jgi:hypothetical protein